GLVPGPHGAHPRQGARPRQRRAHGTALLPGPRDRCRVPEGAVHSPGQPRRRGLRRLDQDGRSPIAPTLVVVSGPPRSGKTTLAHALAEAIPCPAICRDEIKEGLVHPSGEFEPAPGDGLTELALPLFFDVLRLLLAAEVTVVAEAAFQDHVWRPRLEELTPLADLRVVQCRVQPAVAHARRRM